MPVLFICGVQPVLRIPLGDFHLGLQANDFLGLGTDIVILGAKLIGSLAFLFEPGHLKLHLLLFLQGINLPLHLTNLAPALGNGVSNLQLGGFLQFGNLALQLLDLAVTLGNGVGRFQASHLLDGRHLLVQPVYLGILTGDGAVVLRLGFGYPAGFVGLKEALHVGAPTGHLRIELCVPNLAQDGSVVGLIDRDGAPALRAFNFSHIWKWF